MKKNKKLMVALCFCLGAAIFVTTAFADIASKSGYDRLKDTFKFTASGICNDIDNYTMELSVSMKDNSKLLATTSKASKYDMAEGRGEQTTIEEHPGIKRDSNYYWDKNCHISYSSSEDTYYVSNYSVEHPNPVKRDNPFEDERVKDIEKLMDAIIGNLSEYVICEENSDGSKEFHGTINDAKIPVAVNAVCSYLFKQFVTNEYKRNNEFQIPQLVDEISIKEVSGRSSVNRDGLMETLFATFVVSGNDKDGEKHDLTVEAAMRLLDIGQTVVNKPDFSGKKVVEKTIDNSYYLNDGKLISNKYIGKWKSDSIIVENDKFVKIGERYLEITSIEDKYVYGKYYEECKEQYKDYRNEKGFEFKLEITEYMGGEFEELGDSVSKEKGSIYFNPDGICLCIYSPGGLESDNNFKPVFED